MNVIDLYPIFNDKRNILLYFFPKRLNYNFHMILSDRGKNRGHYRRDITVRGDTRHWRVQKAPLGWPRGTRDEVYCDARLGQFSLPHFLTVWHLGSSGRLSLAQALLFAHIIRYLTLGPSISLVAHYLIFIFAHIILLRNPNFFCSAFSYHLRKCKIFGSFEF